MTSFDIGIALGRRKSHVSPEGHRGKGQARCKPSTRLSPGSLKSYSIVVVGAASDFFVMQRGAQNVVVEKGRGKELSNPSKRATGRKEQRA